MSLHVHDQKLHAEPLQLTGEAHVIRVVMRDQQGRDRFHFDSCRFDRLEKQRQRSGPVRVNQQAAVRSGDIKRVGVAVSELYHGVPLKADRISRCCPGSSQRGTWPRSDPSSR